MFSANSGPKLCHGIDEVSLIVRFYCISSIQCRLLQNWDVYTKISQHMQCCEWHGSSHNHLRPSQERILPTTTDNESRFVLQLSNQLRKIKQDKRIKFIDKAKKGVYTGVYQEATLKINFYFVLRSLIHFILALFCTKKARSQIVVGWTFWNIPPCGPSQFKLNLTMQR